MDHMVVQNEAVSVLVLMDWKPLNPDSLPVEDGSTDTHGPVDWIEIHAKLTLVSKYKQRTGTSYGLI